ncbi:hypothetical protein SB5439_05143 [Klebsiella variicola]|uniref:hypothetical protein n=1 Tax=Klebsiella variicola TaxID=244366 RepID=UPI00109C07D9|nr:hypothetical protein [Klebsiella variicola]VGQ13103.1 hypothetical protein SB5439_05143 [Klebsiella variicola]
MTITINATLAKTLRDALATLDRALDASVIAMNAAIAVDAGSNEEDCAEMLAVYAADDAVTEAEQTAIRAAGQLALDMAKDYTPVERAMLSDLFKPAIENRFDAYNGTQRAQLLARAHSLAACL